MSISIFFNKIISLIENINISKASNGMGIIIGLLTITFSVLDYEKFSKSQQIIVLFLMAIFFIVMGMSGLIVN